jgi:hypothetical protein
MAGANDGMADVTWVDQVFVDGLFGAERRKRTRGSHENRAGGKSRGRIAFLAKALTAGIDQLFPGLITTILPLSLLETACRRMRPGCKVVAQGSCKPARLQDRAGACIQSRQDRSVCDHVERSSQQRGEDTRGTLRKLQAVSDGVELTRSLVAVSAGLPTHSRHTAAHSSGSATPLRFPKKLPNA